MKLLVLGGSHFVGRAVVEAALAAGHDVDVINRGLTGRTADGATLLRADRTDHAGLTSAVGDRSWDAVIDTWSGPPVHASVAAELLGPRTGHYGYVSSRSVYSWPLEIGANESHSVVDASAQDTDDADYAQAKRGSELGVLGARPDALVARAGLILGPYEDIGRLPWWFQRLRRGGEVIAPGPASRPLQYIDARDLADWMLRCAVAQVGGVFNTVSPPGHTTIGELLRTAVSVTASTADLVWLTPEEIAAEEIAPWTELPIWLPPDGPLAGLHDADVSRALDAGLRCRPVSETIEDTWSWLVAEGAPPQREDRPAHGLDPQREAAILARRASR